MLCAASGLGCRVGVMAGMRGMAMRYLGMMPGGSLMMLSGGFMECCRCRIQSGSLRLYWHDLPWSSRDRAAVERGSAGPRARSLEVDPSDRALSLCLKA